MNSCCKMASTVLTVLVSAIVSAASAAQCKIPSIQIEKTESGTPVVKPVPAICAAKQKYTLAIDGQGRKILLHSKGKTDVLNRIPKGFEPSLVGSDTLIGFLPDDFQLYKNKSIVLYVSAIRTNGGNGMGQCGSGSEIYLDVLDLKPARPKIIGHHLIGSCSGIELENLDQSHRALGNISIVDGQLVLKFASYRGYRDAPAATLSRDFKRLDFDSRPLDADSGRNK